MIDFKLTPKPSKKNNHYEVFVSVGSMTEPPYVFLVQDIDKLVMGLSFLIALQREHRNSNILMEIFYPSLAMEKEMYSDPQLIATAHDLMPWFSAMIGYFYKGRIPTLPQVKAVKIEFHNSDSQTFSTDIDYVKLKKYASTLKIPKVDSEFQKNLGQFFSLMSSTVEKKKIKLSVEDNHIRPPVVKI